MAAYYNEIDPYAAQWLRNLIAAGHIPAGDVDERSIEDVRPDDVRGYIQCHFFAGIGGWSHALRLAGWPDDQQVWTGSCPCQPFSEIGGRQGFVDERDLWPDFFRLIDECHPPMVFGEQVAEQTLWFDRAAADLERVSYAFAGAVLPACCVDAPILRERFFFVACPSGQQMGLAGLARQQSEAPSRYLPGTLKGEGHWSDWSAAECEDGKLRRLSRGIEFLENGIPDRLAKLRAFGNAIVPQVAAEFIIAASEAVTAPTVSEYD